MSVQVKCAQCGRVVLIDLTTEEVGRDEREMGAEVEYETSGETTCKCGNEISYSQSEWEYPEGVPNHSEGPVISGGELV